jgi:hypothetical protein
MHGGSRGGLTTKIHALVDGNDLPITLKLTKGQAMTGAALAARSGMSVQDRSCSLIEATLHSSNSPQPKFGCGL